MEDRGQAQAYMADLEKKDFSEFDEEIKKAEEYNNELINTVILTDPFDYSAYELMGEKYVETLNVNGDGLIGFVEIPSINVNLPIYHGTSEEVLKKGAGHLENTSLPVGGPSTHSVISAHTAFPTKTFFDYLTDMNEGDVFYLKILNRTLKYKVDQIKVVLPDNVDDLYVEEGKDYCTLLTCTPYSINTHRLLVRGIRVPYEPEKEKSGVSSMQITDNYLYFMGYRLPFIVVPTLIILIILISLLTVFMAIKRRRKNA